MEEFIIFIILKYQSWRLTDKLTYWLTDSAIRGLYKWSGPSFQQPVSQQVTILKPPLIPTQKQKNRNTHQCTYTTYEHTIKHTPTHTLTQTNKQTEDTPCLSLDVKRGQSLINLISLDILLIMKYGLFVTRSNSQISSRGRRLDSSVGCLNPCTCSCSTDKVL